MRISIFGLGYVGAVTAACLAQDGHAIVGVDVDPTKIAMFREGRSPIIEEGLPDLIQSGVRSGRIRVMDDGIQAIRETETSLVCVGTPNRRNGSLDSGVIQRVMAQIGAALKNDRENHLIIIRSTLLPGSVSGTLIPILEAESGKEAGRDFDICFNPEFLREGTSVKDFYNPPFTVIGTRHQAAAERVAALYRSIQSPLFITTIEAAEMIKCTCNTFHALKIAFANEIGTLCKLMNIDSHEVMKIFCADSKLNVSAAYLKPGFAFGGSCLPKDLRAMEYQARNFGYEMPLIKSILPSNNLHIERAIQTVLDTGRRNIGLLGLSFKPGTDDLRESPLVVLAERLLGKGLELLIFDENVNMAKLVGANKRYIEKEIPHLSRLMVSAPEQLFKQSSLIIVGDKSPVFARALESCTNDNHVIIDLVRINEAGLKTGANYDGICW
ncbi:MAG: nucleotide sugar dehydrogenase [Acidobacteriia bacterium]|nr:nucleotide sugar dehydrogenase [Terriglobia bacterium]